MSRLIKAPPLSWSKPHPQVSDGDTKKKRGGARADWSKGRRWGRNSRRRNWTMRNCSERRKGNRSGISLVCINIKTHILEGCTRINPNMLIIFNVLIIVIIIPILPFRHLRTSRRLPITYSSQNTLIKHFKSGKAISLPVIQYNSKVPKNLGEQ